MISWGYMEDFLKNHYKIFSIDEDLIIFSKNPLITSKLLHNPAWVEVVGNEDYSVFATKGAVIEIQNNGYPTAIKKFFASLNLKVPS